MSVRRGRTTGLADKVQRAAGNRRRKTENPWAVLAIVLSATFMQLVDVSIVNVAIPSIQRELHASFAAVQLVVAAYLLGFAGTLITAARLGDIYGRKRLFLVGMIGFTASSALCGAAPTAAILVVGRLVQGIMAGLMFPQVLSVIQVTFPPSKRGRAFGIYGAIIGLATILGPLLGGVLIGLDIFGLDWRAIFYVNVPIGVVAATAAIGKLGESRSPDAPRLDILGALLATTGLGLLVYPLAEGRQQGWPPWAFVMLAASVPLLVIFALYEVRKTRRNDSPLIVMSLFSDRAFFAGALLSAVFFAGLAPFFFTISLYLQVGLGFSALHAGLTTFPFAIGSGGASALSDRIARQIGRGVLILATVIAAAGMASIAAVVHLAGTDLHSYYLTPVLIVTGVGIGLFIAPLNNIVLANVRGHAAGSASGVLSTMQRIGATVGITFAGVLFFLFLTMNSQGAANAEVPRLHERLTSAGLSTPAVDRAVDGFTACFDDRAAAEDPSVAPASCTRVMALVHREAPGSTSSQASLALSADALPSALGRDFSVSFQQSIGYEVAIYLAAFGLVFLLPKKAQGERDARSMEAG